jgi:1-acyl-sn-glycerol-3-phosphate acyltransferase
MRQRCWVSTSESFTAGELTQRNALFIISSPSGDHAANQLLYYDPVSTDGAGKAQQRVRRVVHPVARRLWKFELEGFDRLPVEGPAILCPNHVSFLDSAFLMLNVPRNISFVGKAEYMDSWKTKYLFPWMGMIPIDRAGGDKSQAALETAEAVLRRGELFGIFPEGTRSRDGMLHKGRTGAARLALKVGCPIYPVGVVGTREIQPPDAKVPKLHGTCTIKIGRPINVERYRNRADDHMVLRQITDELMYEIRDLTGQDYRNVYAGKTAETEPTVVAKVANVTDEQQQLVGSGSNR